MSLYDVVCEWLAQTEVTLVRQCRGCWKDASATCAALSVLEEGDHTKRQSEWGRRRKNILQPLMVKK
jgi:hypothetical protein